MVAQLPLEVAGILSVWLETLLYGVYCSLFFETVYIILKKRMTKTRPSKVFFVAINIMFILSTVHIAVNLYRLLRGYVWLRDTVGPTAYFLNLGRWDNIAHDAINAVVTWIGDFLVIYRCFIVWNNNYYIIILPALFLIMSIISNSIALHLFGKVPLGTIFGPTLVHWMNTIYALALVQNTWTTGLIAWRIWRQERASAVIGLRSATSQSSLIPIVRIVIESAAIYVLELIVLIILYALNHNAQFILQEALVPTVGIVFTLMTVRLAMRSSKSLMTTERGGFPIEWRVTAAAATTDLGPTTLATVETNEMQLKSLGAAGVIYELESQEVDERTSNNNLQGWK